MPGCHITWPLLAGIGKVESAHASGGRVEANGNTRGKILGPVLDGGPGMAAITDTDQGLYDGDTAWDRAVGPMQFIPGTWTAFGADGNGDGVRGSAQRVRRGPGGRRLPVFGRGEPVGSAGPGAGGAALQPLDGLRVHGAAMDADVRQRDRDDPGHRGRDPAGDRRQRQRGRVERPDPDGHVDPGDDPDHSRRRRQRRAVRGSRRRRPRRSRRATTSKPPATSPKPPMSPTSTPTRPTSPTNTPGTPSQTPSETPTTTPTPRRHPRRHPRRVRRRPRTRRRRVRRRRPPRRPRRRRSPRLRSRAHPPRRARRPPSRPRTRHLSRVAEPAGFSLGNRADYLRLVAPEPPIHAWMVPVAGGVGGSGNFAST